MANYRLCWLKSVNAFYIFDEIYLSHVRTSPTIPGKCIDGNLLFEFKIKVCMAIPFQLETNEISWISNINLNYIPDQSTIQNAMI